LVIKLNGSGWYLRVSPKMNYCMPIDSYQFVYPNETRLTFTDDVTVGDYLTSRYDMDMQVVFMNFYRITGKTKSTVTIEELKHDGRGLRKPIILRFKLDSEGRMSLNNKSYRKYLTTFVKAKDYIHCIDSTEF